MLERTTELRKNTQRLVQEQADDVELDLGQETFAGRDRTGGGGTYLLYDKDLLWIAAQGQTPRIAMPRVLMPARGLGSGTPHRKVAWVWI